MAFQHVPTSRRVSDASASTGFGNSGPVPFPSPRSQRMPATNADAGPLPPASPERGLAAAHRPRRPPHVASSIPPPIRRVPSADPWKRSNPAATARRPPSASPSSFALPGPSPQSTSVPVPTTPLPLYVAARLPPRTQQLLSRLPADVVAATDAAEAAKVLLVAQRWSNEHQRHLADVRARAVERLEAERETRRGLRALGVDTGGAGASHVAAQRRRLQAELDQRLGGDDSDDGEARGDDEAHSPVTAEALRAAGVEVPEDARGDGGRHRRVKLTVGSRLGADRVDTGDADRQGGWSPSTTGTTTGRGGGDDGRSPLSHTSGAGPDDADGADSSTSQDSVDREIARLAAEEARAAALQRRLGGGGAVAEPPEEDAEVEVATLLPDVTMGESHGGFSASRRNSAAAASTTSGATGPSSSRRSSTAAEITAAYTRTSSATAEARRRQQLLSSIGGRNPLALDNVSIDLSGVDLDAEPDADDPLHDIAASGVGDSGGSAPTTTKSSRRGSRREADTTEDGDEEEDHDDDEDRQLTTAMSYQFLRPLEGLITHSVADLFATLDESQRGVVAAAGVSDDGDAQRTTPRPGAAATGSRAIRGVLESFAAAKDAPEAAKAAAAAAASMPDQELYEVVRVASLRFGRGQRRRLPPGSEIPPGSASTAATPDAFGASASPVESAGRARRRTVVPGVEHVESESSADDDDDESARHESRTSPPPRLVGISGGRSDSSPSEPTPRRPSSEPTTTTAAVATPAASSGRPVRPPLAPPPRPIQRKAAPGASESAERRPSASRGLSSASTTGPPAFAASADRSRRLSVDSAAGLGSARGSVIVPSSPPGAKPDLRGHRNSDSTGTTVSLQSPQAGGRGRLSIAPEWLAGSQLSPRRDTTTVMNDSTASMNLFSPLGRTVRPGETPGASPQRITVAYDRRQERAAALRRRAMRERSEAERAMHARYVGKLNVALRAAVAGDPDADLDFLLLSAEPSVVPRYSVLHPYSAMEECAYETLPNALRVRHVELMAEQRNDFDEDGDLLLFGSGAETAAEARHRRANAAAAKAARANPAGFLSSAAVVQSAAHVQRFKGSSRRDNLDPAQARADARRRAQALRGGVNGPDLYIELNVPTAAGSSGQPSQQQPSTRRTWNLRGHGAFPPAPPTRSGGGRRDASRDATQPTAARTLDVQPAASPARSRRRTARSPILDSPARRSPTGPEGPGDFAGWQDRCSVGPGVTPPLTHAVSPPPAARRAAAVAEQAPADAVMGLHAVDADAAAAYRLVERKLRGEAGGALPVWGV